MEKTLRMNPAAGQRLLRFVGDRIRVTLGHGHSEPLPEGWRAFLRTNLGRAKALREEIIASRPGRVLQGDACWHDVPMGREGGVWSVELSLTEVGYFQAKACAADSQGRQHWPEGPDWGITVHPNEYRAGNVIYCAFVRLFGPTKAAPGSSTAHAEELSKLDKLGYTVIPASGKLRDLKKELPHIFERLGSRILHLLPVNPTPTTYGRMGRFGSPYACLDLTAIDPALIDFDRRSTGVEQFCELAYAVHQHGGRLFLDLVINHTGWSSRLQENRPEWYWRERSGKFISPGAWGVIWEDLIELDHSHRALWDELAEAFLIWCRRGVDGFRCDAGYKVPQPVWAYIIARVREEFADTLFLLEGLGGAWDATENLLTHGGMQWAYSELFQNISPEQVSGYLDYSNRQSERVGVLVHYSETHDNERLAKRSKAWSLLRNRLSALASSNGGFGFTCGAEWLATEKINVHGSAGLAWGNPENLLSELRELNWVLAEHPSFFDGAQLTRLSAPDSPVFALQRISAEGLDKVLVLVNTDTEKEQTFSLRREVYRELDEPRIDLLKQPAPQLESTADGQMTLTLRAGACYCLAVSSQPRGLSGEAYRRTRAQAAWGLACIHKILPMEFIGPCDWRSLAAEVEADPVGFLSAVSCLVPGEAKKDLLLALRQARNHFPQVVVWKRTDRRRVTLFPPRHWLLIEDRVRFRASLQSADGKQRAEHVESIPVALGMAACFGPFAADSSGGSTDLKLTLERYESEERSIEAIFRRLSARPSFAWVYRPGDNLRDPMQSPLALLTNGMGGMARVCVDLGRIKSKYDCVLGANLHAHWPIDRHIFIKRVRVWVNADGFITALDGSNLAQFEPGPPARWQFIAAGGDAQAVEVQLEMDMLDQRNSTVLRFSRSSDPPTRGKQLPEDAAVRLTVRVDLEDRNFHSETTRNEGADRHFSGHCHPLRDQIGFKFTPARDRQVRIFASVGHYYPQPEWSENIPHPVEQSRGQQPSGDAFSPGWFDLPLPRGGEVFLVACADPDDPPSHLVFNFVKNRMDQNTSVISRAQLDVQDDFGCQLAAAAQAFLVRRNGGKTVIAGYPWFLDWGRDSLIAARGLVAAGLLQEVAQLLITYGRFVHRGTLPNHLMGDDASNRDTSDAPLWYGIVCEELAELLDEKFYAIKVKGGRTMAEVLGEIGYGYCQGTPNGIRLDPHSGLIWNPKHFTWMDTNYPAGTPREGYPIEIQVLWTRLLRQLERLGIRARGEPWGKLARRAEESIRDYFWLDEKGYLADCLNAGPSQPASSAVRDTALRSNYLLAVVFGLLEGERAQRAVRNALNYLVVPGGLRSLAPLPVSPPLAIYKDGRLLNSPNEPYWGRYEGDEDMRRKPAYHNGTAWTWTFPTLCEALARAWNWSPEAVVAAKAYLGSMDRLLNEGCLGQIPEILDGDAPHQQRGCDAQAWGVTEALRVWNLLCQKEMTSNLRTSII